MGSGHVRPRAAHDSDTSLMCRHTRSCTRLISCTTRSNGKHFKCTMKYREIPNMERTDTAKLLTCPVECTGVPAWNTGRHKVHLVGAVM
eukprot:3822107-Pyramimonas_sp.AAC.2